MRPQCQGKNRQEKLWRVDPKSDSVTTLCSLTTDCHLALGLLCPSREVRIPINTVSGQVLWKLFCVVRGGPGVGMGGRGEQAGLGRGSRGAWGRGRLFPGSRVRQPGKTYCCWHCSSGPGASTSPPQRQGAIGTGWRRCCSHCPLRAQRGQCASLKHQRPGLWDSGLGSSPGSSADYLMPAKPHSHHLEK